MRNFSIFTLLAALLFVGCSDVFVEQESPLANETTLPDLTADFADDGLTRTYVEAGKYLRWHEADLITAFFGNTLNRQYKFKGKTGDNSGTFSLIPSGELGTGNDLDAIYALYPYDENATISDEGLISLTLPSEQSYAENSFGKGANTMVAVTENIEDTFLSFKNACGYLKLNLYNVDGAALKSLTVKGNNDEKIAGDATATIEFGGVPTIVMGNDATTTVTLNCGEGIALGTSAEEATALWIVLPEITFEKGITITVTDTEGSIFEKSTSNSVAITRNDIQPMAALEVEFVPAEVKPANNEIWYTNGSIAEATTPYKTDVFGVNIVSNTYDAEKECWVIKFDGEVTKIGEKAFYYSDSLTSVNIPDSVTTIGDWAFESCSGLTSVNIPDSVTTIGSVAFRYCYDLTSVTIPDSVTTIGHYAFAYCSSLTSVYCEVTTPTTGYSMMFYENAPDRKIYVPYESFNNYKVAWSEYADAIVPYNFEKGEVVEPEVEDNTIPAANEIWYTTTDGEMAELAWAVTNNINPAPTQSYRDDIGCYVVTFSEECYGSSGLTNPCGFSLFDDNSKKKIKTLLFSNGDRLFDNFVNDVGAWKASEMTSLEEINIPDNVTYIREGLFSDLFDLKRVIIGSNVTSIEARAFQGCQGITSITLPENLESIGSFVLWNTGITELIIPDKVQTLYTGNVPSSVISLTIGCSVTNLKEDVWTTRDLSVVYCKPTTPPDNLKLLFYEIDRDMTVYVPTNSIDAYRTILDQYDRVTVEEYDF